MYIWEAKTQNMKKQLLSVFFLFFSFFTITSATGRDSIFPKNFITPPANDECSGAINLSVNPTVETVSFVSGTTAGATVTQTILPQTCSEDQTYSGANDVWFSFTATATKHFINFSAITEEQKWTLLYNVYSGSDCDNLSFFTCRYAGGDPTTALENLIIGTSYKIRVRFPTSENSNSNTFDISVTTPPLPLNDECNAAIPVSVNPTMEIAFFVSGSSIESTRSNITDSCSGQNSGDVWFSFVATSSKQLIYFYNIVSNNVNPYLRFQLFSGIDCAALTSVICHSGSGYVVNDLIMGQNYKIMVYSLPYYTMSFDLSIHNVEAVPNDECITAINIPVNDGTSSELFITAYDLGSTASVASDGCDGYVSNDTWYSFVATNTIQVVRFYDLNDNQIDKPFSLYSGDSCSSLSMITCSSEGLLDNLSVGTTYKIRVNKSTIDSPLNEAFRIRINSIEQLLNDECQNAIAMTVNPNLEKTFFESGSTLLATPSISSDSSSNDIWYSFLATSTQHIVYIDNNVGYFYFNVFPENNCEVPESSDYYGKPGVHLKNLVVGSKYIIRVISYPGNSAAFDISIVTPQAVANDECSNAIEVPVNESLNCELFATGITQGATPSEFDGYSGNDTWFSFTATSKTHIIKFYDLEQTLSTFSYGLYSSDNCIEANYLGGGNSTGGVHNNLIIGNNYKIRLFANNNIALFSGNVKVCITTPPQPINDECSTATQVPVNSTEQSSVFVSGTTLGATASSQINNCQGNADDDVWFRFVATSKFHYIRLDNIVGISNNLKIVVYQGLDCGTMIQLPCINFPLATLNTLTVGENYIVRIFSDSNDANAFASFDITILTPALPINDECSSPIQLSVLEEIQYDSLPESTIYHATNSPQENTCNLTTSDDDVWYEFVATSTRHSIHFLNVYSHIYTILNHAVYTGECTNLTQLYCSDANSSTLENLIIGQAYKIRVWTAIDRPTYTSFKIALGYAPLKATTTQFTNEQLVTDVLVSNPCVNISNITSSTGSNYGSVNGIGYFTNTNPAFPLSSGLILSTGNAANVSGPNLTILSEGNSSAWVNVGDTDLQNLILSATGQTMASKNATKLEFDFTSQNEFMSFNFLFASEEYGVYQCNYADAFAFLLTDLTTGITKNLAVVPGTNTPISVVTIRNNEHNPSCTSQNESFFDKFYDYDFLAPINFNGQTTLMSASSEIIANNPYHIKLVIADRQDPMYDSAVFIQAGSFSSGPPQCTDKIQLVAFIDQNNNGTKEDTESSFTYGSFVYQVNNIGDINNISSPIGNYAIYDSNPLNSYDFSYEVHPEYANYFSSGTIAHNDISIAVGSGTQTLYFPITQIQGYNDVTVSIVPIGQPTAGFSYANKVVYTNLGTSATSGTITYTKDSLVTVGTSQAGVANTSDGFIYNFVNLAPFETRSFNFNINVPSIPVVNIDDVLESSVVISAPTNDINNGNNTFTNSQIVVASYDPNDKMEAHGGKLDFNNFSQDDYLFYTIRFQNTGTANAINIRIEDMLDAQLDEESIRMVSASHNYVMERVGNKLVWKFDYIYLPSMLANEELSNGYLTFKIKVKPGFEVGDIIPNFAEIYFDTNPAIITNIFNSTFEVQLSTPEFSSGNLLIYPNPSNGLVYINTQNTTENLKQINLYDVLGKIILSSKNLSAKQSTIDVSALSKGVYMIEITTENNFRQIKKLVVN